jgi:hypothetical protein
MSDFNEQNIKNIIDEYKNHKLFFVSNIKSCEENTITKNNIKITSEHTSENKYYNVIDKNKYLWFFYILNNSYENYININKKFKYEQKFKFDIIDKIMNDEDISDKLKFEASNDIGNNNNISIQTLKIIATIFMKNIILESNSFCEILRNNDSTEYNIIDINRKLLYEKSINIDEIENKYYIVNNIETPLKSISGYKLCDLQKICLILDNDFDLFKDKDNKKNEKQKPKKKTKKDLYDYILSKR